MRSRKVKFEFLIKLGANDAFICWYMMFEYECRIDELSMYKVVCICKICWILNKYL